MRNALESKLRVKLCVRSRSEFLLTEAGMRLFNRQLCDLAAAHPRMKLALQTFTTETLQQLIASGEVDLGIGIFTKKHSDPVYNAIAWNDIVTRDRILLEREIFSKKRLEGMEIRYYSNALAD